MSLEDPNDPNVQARGKRMKEAMRYMHVLHACALQVSMAQNMFLPTSGAIPMASEYTPTQSEDVITLVRLEEILNDLGI